MEDSIGSRLGIDQEDEGMEYYSKSTEVEKKTGIDHESVVCSIVKGNKKDSEINLSTRTSKLYNFM